MTLLTEIERSKHLMKTWRKITSAAMSLLLLLS